MASKPLGDPLGIQPPCNQQRNRRNVPGNVPGYFPAPTTHVPYDHNYQITPQALFQRSPPNAFSNNPFVPAYPTCSTIGPLTPPRDPVSYPRYHNRHRTNSQSSRSDSAPELARGGQQYFFQRPGDFSLYSGGQGSSSGGSVTLEPVQTTTLYAEPAEISPGLEVDERGPRSPGSSTSGVEKETASPEPPTPPRRRQGQGAERQSKCWKGARGRDREPEETYCLTPLPKEKVPGYDTGAEPQATLTDKEYYDLFEQLNKCFCRTTYNWLATHKFRIPVSKSMKEHKKPEDRELTEYVQIVKKLIEGREVPNHAVRDERIKEVISIMEGAAEIRHINIHVSRKPKPDRRVLGFIAAVADYCSILGDDRGAVETNNLYAKIDQQTRERQSEILARPPPPPSAPEAAGRGRNPQKHR